MILTEKLTIVLHQTIPISKAMQVKVTAIGEQGLSLSAELSPNINDKGTAFAGSINTLATIAGWLWLDYSLKQQGFNADVVIQHGSIDYQKPITTDFEAHCRAPQLEAFNKFLTTLLRRKRARLALAISISSAKQNCASFNGHYVATL